MADNSVNCIIVLQQTRALIKKNYLLNIRNKRVLLLELCATIFFVAVLSILQHTTGIFDDPAVRSPSILPCDTKLFLKRPCFDFVWSGNESLRIQEIVHNIMENNPGRPIPSHKVKSFKTTKELTEWIIENSNHVLKILHLEESNKGVITYAVEINHRSYYIGVEDPLLDQIHFQLDASREIFKSLIQDHEFSWNISLLEFPHPRIAAEKGEDGNLYFIPFILYAASIFGFIFQTSSLVQEKEQKLRQAMTLMGLYDTAYWCSWLIWMGFITIISSIIIVVGGIIFRVDFFTKNNFIIVFLLFFLFQLSMVGFAFNLSVFMRKSSSAMFMSFMIVLLGLVSNIYTNVIYRSPFVRIICSIFPPSPFGKGLLLLLKGDGLGWREMAKCTDHDCITIMYCYKWLVSAFFVWFFLAIYFDNVIPNTEGVRKSIFYFLKPSYWTGQGETTFEEEPNSVPPPENQSVLDEEEVVKQQLRDGVVDHEIAAVQLRGLTKTYSKSTKHDNPCHAIKSLWVNVPRNHLLCLLGPEGAGKSTLNGCLTGMIPVTTGDALIYGNSVRNHATMPQIRRKTGVCTQFDTLWEKLSAQEHLELCASIKGINPARGVRSMLHAMQLREAADVRVESYSGGMKRCLSVAIAFFGNPRVVILDEPTTGMDVVTRMNIWSVIEDYKFGHSIIVTTRSPEEADALSDRIGIMVKGRLRCIGSSSMLKSQFDTGMTVKVSFLLDAREADIEAVKQIFNEHLEVLPIDDRTNPLSFMIPDEKENLLELFLRIVENRESQFGILDIQIDSITLEQVLSRIVELSH